MRKLVCFLFCLLGLEAYSQDLSLWKKSTLDSANTAANVALLTPEEKKIYLLTNLARLDGKSFIKNVLDPFVKENDTDKDEYLESLYADLQTLGRLKPLMPNEKLHHSAAHHANDMGKNGKIGHESSDGTDLHTRIKRYHQGHTVLAENCSYGYDDALNIVMQLLIDDNRPEKKHRNVMLGKGFLHMGVSIKDHKAYGANCVMDFSD
jgi:Cysteine-rich secretory protein family.